MRPGALPPVSACALMRRCLLAAHDKGAAHDLWQAFLFAPAGEWTEVHVPLERFLKTWRGKVCVVEVCEHARGAAAAPHA